MGLPFFGLKDYSQRQGHLSSEQEKSLKTHFTNNHARNADEICAYILAEYGQSYCPSGAVKLMHRLGFIPKGAVSDSFVLSGIPLAALI